jgi:hypothetical protein
MTGAAKTMLGCAIKSMEFAKDPLMSAGIQGWFCAAANRSATCDVVSEAAWG